ISHAPLRARLNCSRPGTARTAASPAAICASVAPALAAAAAAARALAMLCAPPSASSIATVPAGECRRKRVRKPPASREVWTSLAAKSARSRTPKVTTCASVRLRHSEANASSALMTAVAVGASDTLEAAEAFEVLGAGVGDQPDGRTRHLDERRHLARVVGPHLHDRKAMLGSEAQQGERHADVVGEIAPRREGCADLA